MHIPFLNRFSILYPSVPYAPKTILWSDPKQTLLLPNQTIPHNQLHYSYHTTTAHYLNQLAYHYNNNYPPKSYPQFPSTAPASELTSSWTSPLALDFSSSKSTNCRLWQKNTMCSTCCMTKCPNQLDLICLTWLETFWLCLTIWSECWDQTIPCHKSCTRSSTMWASVCLSVTMPTDPIWELSVRLLSMSREIERRLDSSK